MCGPPPPPTTITITLSATTANPTPLTINDGTVTVSSGQNDTNLVTGVKPTNIVVFKKMGDISCIAIRETGGQDVFSTDPTAQLDGSWKGVIGSLPANTETTYTIMYVVGTTIYQQDPKIRINP